MTMAQNRQEWRSRTGSDLVWLASLIDSFERVSRSDVRAAPCDPLLLTAVRDQLLRPAAPRQAALN
jgi:hypothetical protein